MKIDDGVIVVSVDEENCHVVPPAEGDSAATVGLKVFILACLHRRNLDPGFDRDMLDWMMSYDPDDFRKEMEVQLKGKKAH